MTKEVSKKLENVRDKVNNSREKAIELRKNVYNFRRGIESDINNQELGEYFAAENGYSDLREIQEDLEDLKENMRGELGLAACAEQENAEELLSLTSDVPEEELEETAEELSEIGDLYDESQSILRNTAEKYISQLEDEETELYGDQEIDNLFPEGGQMYQNGEKVYMPDTQNLPPLQKLNMAGEKLNDINFNEYESSAKAAADD